MSNTKITIIKATKTQSGEDLKQFEVRKKRIAIYARVSTNFKEQEPSFILQVNGIKDSIEKNPNKELVGVYTDKGFSGARKNNRQGFIRMMKDAKAGKFDIIITKSISRFSRSTIDCLRAIRELKECGVEVFFEKENIHTFDRNCEPAITMFSAIAEEESRALAANIQWSYRKRFREGKVLINYSCFLGYKKGEDEKPQVVEDEAKIVREIYELFLAGYSIAGIKNVLENKKYLTPRKKESWNVYIIDRRFDSDYNIKKMYYYN